jgi:anti-anti-sigma factor
MQKSGLEWFWRMSGSPARLAARYRKDFVFLLTAVWQQAASQRRRKSLGGTIRQGALPAPHQAARVTRIAWHGDLQRDGLAGAASPATVTAPVLLDAGGVTFMDSAGLGQLALLIRTCRAAGQLLVVVRPAQAFKTAVTAVRMDSLFPMVDSEAEALAWLARHQASGGRAQMTADGVAWVAFDRSLDALYHDEMMALLEAAISNNAAAVRTLVVDLRAVGFIDSRAVGGLIRAWKIITARGGAMFLAGANPALREIIGLLHLDQILAEWKGDFPE